MIGTAVKAVAFPAFAERGRAAGARDVDGLVRGTELLWALSLPVSLGLAVLAHPVVTILYPAAWEASATVLTALALFGAARVVFDLWTAYLTACGASGWLVTNQILWIAFLTPAMYLGIAWDGLRGAGWSHVVIAVVAMVPVHLVALGRHHVPAWRLLKALVPPSLAALPSAVLAVLTVRAVPGALLQLLLGGIVLVIVYSACIWPWLRHRLPSRSPTPDPETPTPLLVGER